jgi:plastocyanin
MKNRILLISILIVTGFLVSACNLSAQESSGSTATPAVSETATEQDLLQTGISVVKMYNLSFVPEELTIPVGTTVRWTNEDTLQHTATADNGSFDSKTLNYGESYSVKFDKAGTYTYKCTNHITMIGKIIVTAK